MKNRAGSEEMLRCSLCHKSQDAVAKLISSPSDYPRAYICDECVAVCNSILEDDRTATPPSTTPNQLPNLHEPPENRRRHRTEQVEHHAHRPDRHWQDAAGADSGPHA